MFFSALSLSLTHTHGSLPSHTQSHTGGGRLSALRPSLVSPLVFPLLSLQACNHSLISSFNSFNLLLTHSPCRWPEGSTAPSGGLCSPALRAKRGAASQCVLTKTSVLSAQSVFTQRRVLKTVCNDGNFITTAIAMLALACSLTLISAS